MATHKITKVPCKDMLGDPSHEHHITINGIQETLMSITVDAGNTYFETDLELIGALYDMYQVSDGIKEGDNFEYEGVIIAKTYSCHVVPADFVPPPVVALHVCHDKIDELREGEFNPDNFLPITGHPGYVFDQYYKGYSEADAIDYLDRVTFKNKGIYPEMEVKQQDTPTTIEIPQRKIHTVTWVIEVDAETPEEAAREALNIMQDQESTATCFTVDDKQGNVTDIDLSPDCFDTYSPDCFDGRFFKWDGYVLDTVTQEDDEIYTVTKDGERVVQFSFSILGYEDDQEAYLNGMLEEAKYWVKNHQE